jgi:hypothetical protein
MPGNSNGNGSNDPPRKRPNPLQGMREEAERQARKRIKEMEERASELIEQYRESGYSYEEAMAEFEQARDMAITTRDANAMTAASIAKAKLSGLWIDKSAVLHAHAGIGSLHGESPEQLEAAAERMRERIGSAGADRLLAFLRKEGFIRDIPPQLGAPS